MRTNIEIDDALMRDALRVTGLRTKREVVELGLRKLLRLAEQARLLAGSRDIEAFLAQFDLARFDAGMFEQVVDDREKMFAGFADVARIFDITLVGDLAHRLVLDEGGEAENGVQRRAQFVAHIGEERRFRLVGASEG